MRSSRKRGQEKENATSSLVATGDSLTEGWGVTPRSLLAYRAVYESK